MTMPVNPDARSFPQNIPPGFVGARGVQLKSLLPQHLSRRYWRYIFDPMDSRPSAYPSVGYGAAPGAAVNNLNLWDTNYGSYEYHLKSNQVILAPVFDAVNGLGIDISLDQTAGRGVEIGFAANITAATTPVSKTSVLAGTVTAGKAPFGDPAFFARAEIYLTAGAAAGAPLAFGYRKMQAYQSAAIGNYTDYAAFDITAGAVRVNTNIGGAGSAVTVLTGPTTNWGNTTEHELMLIGDQQGNIRFFFDQLAIIPNVAFQFTAGTVLMPFLWYVHGATTSNVFVSEFEAGLLKPQGV